MRTSKYLLFTNKKKYTNDIDTNNLIIKSRLIKKISSGIYVFLPLGIRIIDKIKKIIKIEMEKQHAIEMLIPILQPSFLWENSGRKKIFGNELFKIIDRKKKFFILAPTNEEIITYILYKEIKSYKKFPIILYQINTKYRDEIRPKAGIIRCKEFIMKDAYSFHTENKSLKKVYFKMYNAYIKIFNHLNIKFYIVKTKSKKMGGKVSHEFHSKSKNGENYILTIENYKISKKIIVKNILKNNFSSKNQKTSNFVKIFLMKSKKNKKNIIAIIQKKSILKIDKIKKYCNDNTIKFEKKKNVKRFIKQIKDSKTFLKIRHKIIVDLSVLKLKNFYIYKKINKNKENNFSDSKKNMLIKKNFEINKSIEMAHIFQIGEKYSKKNNFFIKNKKKKNCFVKMGCYGIGITRLIPIIIEQNHDNNEIKWPTKISPFKIIILPINKQKNLEVHKTSENIYKTLKKNNIEVLIEDRIISPGKMFFESDLLGITHIIIVSEKYIKKNIVEYKNRILNIKKLISVNKILQTIL
ncbi:aminoacyl--tRNA ligase-related protein [Buchnera aphidicola (Astegopteryx bambusae)]|uniref:aminoacyl--tRNA ligase-related protein n=1 Tax=Buchnera aphidicola TaxID=9 RepID=UPI0031B7FA3C